MSCASSQCIAVRLRNAESAPVTPIAWVNPKLAEVDHLSAPTVIEGKRTTVRYNIIKREHVLIGDTLVHELNLALHDPRPTTLKGHVMAWWRAGLPKRQDNLVPWVVGGALLMAIGLVFVGWFGQILLTFFSHPFESMIWVWVKLGRFLPAFAFLSALFLLIKAWRSKRPLYVGMTLCAALALPMLAIDIRAALFDIVPEGAKFPDAYGDKGQLVLANLVDKTAQFYGELSVIWGPLTILLNGVGLAGLVAFVDSIGGWGVTQLAKREPQEGESPADVDLAGAMGFAVDGKDAPKFHVPQFTLKVPLDPLKDPHDIILERPERC